MKNKYKKEISNYLLARSKFLDFADSLKNVKLNGNDNIIGRIGEYIAMEFLRTKDFKLEKMFNQKQ